jgi:thiol-disulfide isomerase/thioredoxin
MNNFLKYSLPFLLTLFYCLFGFITYGDHRWMLLLTLSSTFILSFLIFKKSESKDFIKNNLLFILPLLLINIIIFILYGEYTRGLLYVIFIPVSSYLAYFYFKNKKNVIPIGSVLLFTMVGFVMFPNLYIYLKNNNAETNADFPVVAFVNKKNETIILEKDKIVVLDFWSVNCGICFDKFPDLENTFLKYKNNPSIKIYAVNVPMRHNVFSKTSKILDSIGYTFPKIYAKSSQEVEDSLKINSFPHLLILKNGKIRYDGMLETEKNVFLYNIESEIDKLLEE